jgi:AcrR family transcriptional regulator
MPSNALEIVPVLSEDRRSTRSKRIIRQAYIALIEERGLDGFSVGDLTECADLNRGTFYAHYKGMDDLHRSFEQEIVDSLASLKPQLQAVPLTELVAFSHRGVPPHVCVEVFDILHDHAPLLRLLLSPKGDAAFQARLRDHLCTDLMCSVLHEKYTRDPKPLTEYYIAYYASALVGLIWHWLERDTPESSEEMARIMLSIMFLKPGDPIELKGA